jgi:hypothetical protein
MMIMPPLRVIVLSIVLLSAAASARADTLLFTLDTSPLSGIQTLAFGLTNSDSSANQVSLSAFDFGGGSAVAGSQDCTFGGFFSGLGCSGDMTSGVTLDDVDLAAFFTQQFDAGSTLSFLLTSTNNYTGPVPDQFAFYLCNATINTCYSDDASGAMLLLDLVGGPLSPSSFVPFGASGQGLDSPTVTAAPVAVPEPGTLLLVFSGGLSVAARVRRLARLR